MSPCQEACVHKQLHEAREAHHQRAVVAEDLHEARQTVHSKLSICEAVRCKETKSGIKHTNAEALEDLALNRIDLLICLRQDKEREKRKRPTNANAG
jgi:hypothetical protein